MRTQFNRGRNVLLLAAVLLAIHVCTPGSVAQEQRLNHLNTYVENAMAECLLQILDNGTLREDLSRATAVRAEQYSWDSVSRRYLELADAAH